MEFNIVTKGYFTSTSLLRQLCSKQIRHWFYKKRNLTPKCPTHVYQNLDPLELIPSNCHPKRDLQKLTVPISSGDRVGASGERTNDLTVLLKFFNSQTWQFLKLERQISVIGVLRG